MSISVSGSVCFAPDVEVSAEDLCEAIETHVGRGFVRYVVPHRDVPSILYVGWEIGLGGQDRHDTLGAMLPEVRDAARSLAPHSFVAVDLHEEASATRARSAEYDPEIPLVGSLETKEATRA